MSSQCPQWVESGHPPYLHIGSSLRLRRVKLHTTLLVWRRLVLLHPFVLHMLHHHGHHVPALGHLLHHFLMLGRITHHHAHGLIRCRWRSRRICRGRLWMVLVVLRGLRCGGRQRQTHGKARYCLLDAAIHVTLLRISRLSPRRRSSSFEPSEQVVDCGNRGSGQTAEQERPETAFN